jgi:hypothetical protein
MRKTANSWSFFPTDLHQLTDGLQEMSLSESNRQGTNRVLFKIEEEEEDTRLSKI